MQTSTNDGFMEKRKHVTRIGREKILSVNIVVIDDPAVGLTQRFEFSF